MNLMQKMRKGNQKGMTLIELLGVIVIIGILFVVLNAAINASTDSAKLAGVKTDFRALQMGFEQQVRETGALPKSVDEINKYIDMQFDASNNNKSDKPTPLGGHYVFEYKSADNKVVIYADANDDGLQDAEEPVLEVTIGPNGNPLFKTEGLGRDLNTNWSNDSGN